MRIVLALLLCCSQALAAGLDSGALDGSLGRSTLLGGALSAPARRTVTLPVPVVQMIPSNYTPANDPPTLANTGSVGGTWTRTYVYGGGSAGLTAVDATKLTVDAGALFNQIYYSGLPATGVDAGEPFTIAVRITALVDSGYNFNWDIVDNLAYGAGMTPKKVYSFAGSPQVTATLATSPRSTIVLQGDGAGNLTINVDGSQTTDTPADSPRSNNGDIGRSTIGETRSRMMIYRYEVWDRVVPIADVKAIYDAI